MKIITYNLFEGALHTYNQLIAFIRHEKPDILCLQEVNGWQNEDNKKLKDFAEETGLTEYVFGDSNTEYKLATFSREPIISHQVLRKGFWHSAIEVVVNHAEGDLAVVNVHLCPLDEGKRLEEVRQLIDFLKPSIPSVLLGDFNALSTKDAYPDELLHILQRHGIKKFGENNLQFEVINYVETGGFHDLTDSENRISTVPTPFNQDKDHEVPLRVDYAFGSSSLIGGAAVVKTRFTDVISDHYPLRILVD